jgi:hypothetical protein
VMRPSSPEISAPQAVQRPATGTPAAARPAMTPGANTNPGARSPARTDATARAEGRDATMRNPAVRGLPDRNQGYGEDEPTQRAPRPPSPDAGGRTGNGSDDADDADDADTLYGLPPAHDDVDGGPTDEGVAVTAPSPAAPSPSLATSPSSPSLPARLALATDPGALSGSASVSARPQQASNAKYLALAAAIGIGVVVAVVALLPRDESLAVAVDAGSATGSVSVDPRAPGTADAGAKAKIRVESVPPGVNILLDEERIVGKSPTEFEHAPGVVKLQAQFRDQPPIDLEIEVQPGEQRTVRMLAKTPLIVKSVPSRAKVKVNGEVVGETPFERKAVVDPEKPVTIKLELGGYDFPEKVVTPEAGVPLDLGEIVGALRRSTSAPVIRAEPPAAKFGLLNMRSAPWVQVKVKGQVLGNTTFTQIRLPAGRQTLVMTNPEVGINETLVVTVPEDKTLNVSLEWEKKGNDWRIKTRSIK